MSTKKENNHIIPGKDCYDENARLERLSFIQKATSTELALLGKISSFKAEETRGRIENLVGSIEIPVGIAGSLLIKGENESNVAYAPIATVEGTLVASTNRGARALMQSGGTTARVISQRMLRVPMFILVPLSLALDVFTMAVVAANQFASVHKKYG